MRYLGLAFYGEGPTDYSFLIPILYRTVNELCHQSQSQVEIGDIIELVSLDHRITYEKERILRVTQEQEGGYHIVFIHADGDGDWKEAIERHIEPVTQTLIQKLRGIKKREQIVGVVPVREMEAWALADGDTLRGVFGTTLNNAKLGIPNNPKEVESIPDPKLVLRGTHEKAVGRRSKKGVADFLTSIGGNLDLKLLRRVPSFQRFEQDLHAALTMLGYIT